MIPGDLSTLIDFYSFSIWLSYAATILALLVLRYTQPNLPRPYKVRVYTQPNLPRPYKVRVYTQPNLPRPYKVRGY